MHTSHAARGPGDAGVGLAGHLADHDGDGFSTAADDNQVLIGGVEALIVRAATEQLQVVAGEGTESGYVEVRVSGSAPQVGPDPFEVADWPDVRDARTVGPPLFFAGPQHCTPRLRAQNQRVLVILTHGRGEAPANPLLAGYEQSLATERAGRYWREVSYQRTSFRFSYTPWLELPQDRPPTFGTAPTWNGLAGSICCGPSGMLSPRAGRCGPRATVSSLPRSKSRTRAQPAERTGLSSIGTPMHVATRGQIAYVAAGSEGLYVVNLAAPGAPAILTRLTPPGRMLGCDVAGNRLAVAALEGGCTCTTSLRRPLRCS